MRLVSIIALGLLAAASAAEKPLDIFQLMRHGPPPPPKHLGPSKSYETRFFTQKQDHFDIFNNVTWQQRYFIQPNQTYTPGAPIFLYLSGEWVADPIEVEFTFIGELSNFYNGLTIDLEHRYYGQSRPVPDTKTENLKYQSIDQALEDTANFAVTMRETQGWDGPWILVGQSYSANMAAWARARYPHIFLGAYASSAPILAQLDFPEYFEVVNKALEATDPACPAVIQGSTDELDVLIANGDAERITQLFNLTSTIDLANEYDVMHLHLIIAFVFGIEAQYQQSGNLARICENLIAGQSTPLETVAKFIREDINKGSQINIVIQDIYDYYRTNTEFEDDVSRPWWYMVALELGYYQTLSSPDHDQPFGLNVSLAFHARYNTEVYGEEFNLELTQVGIDRTNRVYGGLNPDVTKVIYTHGTLDPWSALGLTTDLNAESPVIVIEGTSHCRDVEVASADDEPQLLAARQRVIDIIGQWLAEAKQ